MSVPYEQSRREPTAAIVDDAKVARFVRYIRDGKNLGPIKVQPEQAAPGEIPTGRFVIVDGYSRVNAARRLHLLKIRAQPGVGC
jgi:hypothetical protein